MSPHGLVRIADLLTINGARVGDIVHYLDLAGFQDSENPVTLTTAHLKLICTAYPSLKCINFIGSGLLVFPTVRNDHYPHNPHSPFLQSHAVFHAQAANLFHVTKLSTQPRFSVIAKFGNTIYRFNHGVRPSWGAALRYALPYFHPDAVLASSTQISELIASEWGFRDISHVDAISSWLLTSYSAQGICAKTLPVFTALHKITTGWALLINVPDKFSSVCKYAFVGLDAILDAQGTTFNLDNLLTRATPVPPQSRRPSAQDNVAAKERLEQRPE